MPNQDIPADAPPEYNDVVGPRTRPAGTTLQVPGQSSIPEMSRRSMEDEVRPLPKGWIRSFDPSNSHQFFVDTTKDPPRSIWHHPYDDDTYLATLSSAERERIEHESMHRGSKPSHEDILAAHSDDDADETAARQRASSNTSTGAGASSSSSSSQLPPRPEGKARSFGRKFKDKLTGTTHEERVKERKRREQEEARVYRNHQVIRAAMARASQTGQPVKIGKDEHGKDLFVTPPREEDYHSGGGFGMHDYGYGASPYDAYGAGYGGPGGIRYAPPPQPYARPRGGGFGGGYGLPLAMGGGLLGGLLLGDVLTGGFI